MSSCICHTPSPADTLLLVLLGPYFPAVLWPHSNCVLGQSTLLYITQASLLHVAQRHRKAGGWGEEKQHQAFPSGDTETHCLEWKVHKPLLLFLRLHVGGMAGLANDSWESPSRSLPASRKHVCFLLDPSIRAQDGSTENPFLANKNSFHFCSYYPTILLP